MRLVWLRSELRLEDHPVLYDACRKGGPVRALVCATPQQWEKHDDAPCKIAFRQALVHTLAPRLASRGIALDVIERPFYQDLPQALTAYCRSHGVKELWYTKEVPVYEQQRDKAVEKAMEAFGVAVHAYDPPWLVPLKGMVNKQGKPYRVFTPWYKHCMDQMDVFLSNPLPAPPAVGPALPLPDLLCWTKASFRADLWPADEEKAQQKLHDFLAARLTAYAQARDVPAKPSTSLLSPYLSQGVLSLRQCVWAAWQACVAKGIDPHTDGWIRQLFWREFYLMIMQCFPWVSQGQPFQREAVYPYETFDDKRHRLWVTGCTGFPFVDAGMRQLKATGWMHNRLRMLTASFYCKLMGMPWWEGERFFMQHLIDGDFPANNGGWQWCASVGCDASPWFRIFHPHKQSETWDPDGTYIKTFVPELAGLAAKDIHNPSDDVRQKVGYPPAMLEASAARRHTLARYQQARALSRP